MTTTTPTAAAYLLGLPVPIQAELVDIAREAIVMAEAEKGFAAAHFATVAAHFAISGSDYSIPGAQMVDHYDRIGHHCISGDTRVSADLDPAGHQTCDAQPVLRDYAT